MTFSINTNLVALNAHRNLSKIDTQREDTLTRLSTGLRINKAIADSALKEVDRTRAALGAVQHQLTSTIANLLVTLSNVDAAESGIRNIDFASEASDFSGLQILSQAGSFALSQANAGAQAVLSLLQR